MKFLKYNFWRVRRDTLPDAQFKRALWKKLDQNWNARYAPSVGWHRTIWARVSIVMSASAIAMGSFGTAVYAYNSPEVVGSPLYPIKTSIELVQEKLQRTPEAKAKFYLNQIAKREAEKKVLERRRQSAQRIDNQIQSVESRLENTNTQLEKIGDNSDALHTQVKKRLLERRERLEKRELKLEGRKNKLEEFDKRSSTRFDDRQRGTDD